MRSLLTRVTVTVFATTFIVVVGLMFVVNYQISENFTSYLYMSGMHGMMMNRGGMAAMMGTPERQFIVSLRHSLVLTSVIMLIIGALVSYFLARSIAVPVINLNKAVNSVSAGDLDTTVTIERQDEVGKLAEAFNEMTAKLKSNTILRQRFLAGVAHELRTPLTILKANLEGIADGIISPDQEQINSLIEEVDRLVKLVGELRDLSLFEAGQMIPEYSDVNLKTTLSQVIQKIKPLANEKNLELILNVDSNIPPFRADNAMLQQMAYNLIINAIRYTAEGSIIVESGIDEQGVFIDVSDTGIGIAPADIEHIFDYFYRVDQARTKQSGGTGLGLALVKQMVTIHGGQVFVKSTSGSGSTFTLKLPLNTHKRSTLSP